MSTEIRYNGSILHTIVGGQTATLLCEGKKMVDNVVVSFGEAGTITYNETQTPILAGQTATLLCEGKKMVDNVVIFANAEVVVESAGLYDVNGGSVATWDKLVGYGMDVEKSGYNVYNYNTDINCPYYVFNRYSLLDGVKLIIANSVTSISVCAFYNCSNLTNVVIPNSVTSVGTNAFAYCNLTSVTIPDSVTKIGNMTFSYCDSLTSVTIGDSVEYIGTNAFYGCSSLTSVIINATTPPTLGTAVFQSTNAGLKIYVPDTAFDAYKGHTNWSEYGSKITRLSDLG